MTGVQTCALPIWHIKRIVSGSFSEREKFTVQCFQLVHLIIIRSLEIGGTDGAEIKMVVTMNARSLINFFRLRCCNRAQWEIRALADEMFKPVSYTHLDVYKRQVLKTEYAHKRRYLNPFWGESNAVFLCPQERTIIRLQPLFPYTFPVFVSKPIKGNS